MRPQSPPPRRPHPLQQEVSLLIVPLPFLSTTTPKECLPKYSLCTQENHQRYNHRKQTPFTKRPESQAQFFFICPKLLCVLDSVSCQMSPSSMQRMKFSFHSCKKADLCKDRKGFVNVGAYQLLQLLGYNYKVLYEFGDRKVRYSTMSYLLLLLHGPSLTVG